jgi:hypothetical protein
MPKAVHEPNAGFYMVAGHSCGEAKCGVNPNNSIANNMSRKYGNNLVREIAVLECNLKLKLLKCNILHLCLEQANSP